MSLGKTSLIIPAYYANEELINTTSRCLASLVSTVMPDEVIVINDGSPLHKIWGTGFIDITMPQNGGYTKAVNKGLCIATGDTLIIGNNDLTFTDNWLNKLLLPLEKGYDIATCATTNQTNVRYHSIESDAKFDSLWAMRRETYEQLGPLDEQFRGYFADTDYRRRALNAGLTIGKNNDLLIGHESKATYKQTDPDDTEYKKAARLYEAKWGFLE